MFSRLKLSDAPGLRTHAFLVSLALVFLTGILGVRAYFIADRHETEMSALMRYDLKAEALLIELESLGRAREQAERKFRVTKDEHYAQLIGKIRSQLAAGTERLRNTLMGAYPDLGARVRGDLSTSALRELKSAIDEHRAERLAFAQGAAQGILRLILIALLVSFGVTAWVLYLFYRGLWQPLQKLSEATLRIGSGELTYRLPPLRGVGEFRKLGHAFNRMAERLESLDHSKKEFLATVSHEIKNPLAALKEGLNLLAFQGDRLTPNSRARTFSACLIASKRVEAMINNLLKVARGGGTGLFEIDGALRNLSEAIQNALVEVRPLAEKRGMSVQLEEEESGLHAAFNPDGMAQILENLLLNAIKYGLEKTVIKVRLKKVERELAEAPGVRVPHVRVSVCNEGECLAPSELKGVFQPFFRGSNSSGQSGLGLGLHVVRQVVQAHHGNVEVSSHDGVTEVRFWIPENYATRKAEALMPGWAPALLCLVVFLPGLSSCASLQRVLHPQQARAATEEIRDWNDLAWIESEKVVVPTAMLRSLLRQERRNQSERLELLGQLEALKKIDLEERRTAR